MLIDDEVITDYLENYIDEETEIGEIYFEPVSAYKDAGLALPERKTQNSAGYDFVCAEDIIIYPQSSYHSLLKSYSHNKGCATKTLEEMAALTKETGARPTLVPTGMKCRLPNNCYLELSARSSTPLKYWLLLANGVGIIDADYYNSEESEGHIYFQFINLSPYPIQLHRGNIIGQGIIKTYLTTDTDTANNFRTGGMGSTSNG